jgi:anti-anti-sigma factor
MEVETNKLGVVTYLTPDDSLTENNLEALKNSIEENEENGPTNIVIDLSHVPLLDSSGLEFLLDLSTQLRESGGSLRVAHANSLCRDILAVTRLDQTIPVCEDVESGGGSFL